MAQTVKLPDWLKEANPAPCKTGGRARNTGFIDKNLESVAAFMKGMLESEAYASRKGIFQRIEARARIAGVLVLIAACAMSGSLWFLSVMLLGVSTISVLSKVGIRVLAGRVAPSFAFTLVLVAPVLFSFMSPGKSITGTAGGVSVTLEGAYSASLLLLRVSVMVALASLLFLTTRQSDFFRGLQRMPVPAFFVTALFMTFRYILILVKLVEDSALAMKSRMISGAGLKQSQMLAASRITLIIGKSLSMADEINMAMASRGFSGTVRTLGDGALMSWDYLWIGFSVFVFLLAAGI